MTGHPEGAHEHAPPPQDPYAPHTRSMWDKAEHGLESLIFWSRWLQAPIYVGLIVAGFLYLYRFGGELVELADHVVYGISIEEMRERAHASAAEKHAHEEAEAERRGKTLEKPAPDSAAPADEKTEKEKHGEAAAGHENAGHDNAGHGGGGHGAAKAAKLPADPPGRRYKNKYGVPGNYIMEEGEFLFRVLTLVDITMVMNLLVMVIIGGYAIFVSKLSVGDHEDHPDWLNHINANTLKIKLSSSLVGITGIHLLKSFIDIDKLLQEPTGNYAMGWEVGVHFTFLLSVLALSFSERMLGHHDPDEGAH